MQPDGTQHPQIPFGQPVKFLPTAAFEALYNEARNALSAGAFTPSVLCCRKLIIHVAVSKGAPVGLGFLEYLEYLNGNAFIPPDAQEWVETIVAKGSEPEHEIAQTSRQDAEHLMIFVEVLLRFIYEFPGLLDERSKRPAR